MQSNHLYRGSILVVILTILMSLLSPSTRAQDTFIKNDPVHRTVRFGNNRVALILDYHRRAFISSMVVNGQQVLDDQGGGYTFVRTVAGYASSRKLVTQPHLAIAGHIISLTGILYGSGPWRIHESWQFKVTSNEIDYTITRTTPHPFEAEQAGTPVFVFRDTAVWNGAYTDYGGIAWFYLFHKPLDTYGVHARSSSFWNRSTGNGLVLSAESGNDHLATDYSRTDHNQIACTVAVAPQALSYRFDPGTHRRRYVQDTTAVWAPVIVPAGTTRVRLSLSWMDYRKVSDRGTLRGIDGTSVADVLNTIARIGVIDRQHFGGNSWHTPYGPICLHEQYIAQLGVGIDDSNYWKGYRDCLDYYRDHAIRPDGRVWPRWAYTNEDAMPGQYTRDGFYEAQWGYLMDSNPDYVSNVSDLFNINGDLAWVKTQRRACEKALDWILRHDTDHNGLVEMMTTSETQKRGSDWLDIIWASWENALVNAKLYHALKLWSAIEGLLGNVKEVRRYESFAERLKTQFNRPARNGGFWDEQHHCYIHWRDRDGSLHGTNMVTPVNFMAIAYGLCDDSDRARLILADIERQMEKEHLFFWPVCMNSYAPGEGNDWQFPFPNYENGDIFLSWGAVGVEAYAAYDPEIALKYVKNVLAQYGKDGLAFQRYGRATQEGLGDDILSGNSLAVVGLYRSLYGIHPLYNRFYLQPHLPEELVGTRLRYTYRNLQLRISLGATIDTVSDGRFTLVAGGDFGFSDTNHAFCYYHGNSPVAALEIRGALHQEISLEPVSCSAAGMSWRLQAAGEPALLRFRVRQLLPGKHYTITHNGRVVRRCKSDSEGCVDFRFRMAPGTLPATFSVAAVP